MERAAPPSLPIVGIGASAGGLEAFIQLLRALPVDTGMGFVLVQHLAPTRESLLAEILSRSTSMPVSEVIDETRVMPNSVYVLPPDREMVIAHGSLQLRPRAKDRAQSRPIDEFLRSLAADQGQQAVGVILSGTGSDGTLGLEEIKAEGGITFAQDDSAQQHGMPHSAIASGCVDFVLHPGGIASEIARIARHPYVAPDHPNAPAGPGASQNLGQVLRLLRDNSGVDFTNYKESTLGRRINRRMVLKKMDGLTDYTRLLQKTPAELDALYQDILISVTSFFRNPELFEALESHVLPQLFADRSGQDPIRVWAVGCSTGEEVYSLAITFAEFAEKAGSRVPVQFFGTDLNGAGIDKARAGIYSKNIAQDVSPQRLARFFSEVDGKYRISKSIRDLCVFAKHNLLSDPPFSRMHLITCRNLLIYLEPETQAKVLRALHFALKPAGVLALGSSETVGSQRGLFELRDAKRRIYVRKPGAAGLPLTPARLPADQDAGSRTPDRVRDAAAGTDMHKEAERLLLAKYAPPGVLIDAGMEIVQVRGDTSSYLVPAPGKASLNLMKMAREELRSALRAAVQKAVKEERPVRQEGLRMESNGAAREVAIEVIPIRGNTETGGGLLVLFEEEGQNATRPAAARKSRAARSQDATEREIARLTEELTSSREYLQSLVEQGEATNEELQSANEEAQSANEELQSVNEELETSKEEIQASNEELATVNDELQDRNAQLDRLNNDLRNVIEGVRLPMVMIGPDLRIRSFTPMAEKVLNLIPTDIGRLMSEVKLNLDVPELGRLLGEVIGSAAPRETDVQDRRGCWQSLRIEPYRTADKRVDGAILLLVDIDALKRAKEYAESVVATIREPFLVLDGELHVETASRSFYETFAHTPEETEHRLLYELGEGQWRNPELQRLLEKVLPEDRSFDSFELEQTFEGLGRKIMLLNARRLAQEPGGRGPLILLAIEDVTERTQLQRLTDSALANLTPDRLFREITHRLREALGADSCSVLLLVPGENILRVRATSGLEQEVEASMEIPLDQGISGTVAATGTVMVVDDVDTIEAAESILLRGIVKSVAAVPILSGNDLRGVLHIGSKSPRHFNEVEVGLLRLAADRVALAIDRARLLEAERQARKSAEEANDAKDAFFISLSHELRTPMTSILGWTQLLEHTGYDPKTTPEGIRNIDRSARLQARLIDDMLDISRMRIGKVSIRAEAVDMKTVVENSVANAKPAASSRGIRLELLLASATVLGDPSRLEQVFGNLLANAIKFSPLNARILVAVEAGDDRVAVCVKDEGRGIAPELLPLVFDRFRQQQKGEYGGLGLGLAIARHLIESHGGTIEAESEGEGKGATFRVVLPLLDPLRGSGGPPIDAAGG